MLTGSEDGTVRIWHSGTYRLESSLNYGLERVWTISSLKGSNNVAIGLVSHSLISTLGLLFTRGILLNLLCEIYPFGLIKIPET